MPYFNINNGKINGVSYLDNTVNYNDNYFQIEVSEKIANQYLEDRYRFVYQDGKIIDNSSSLEYQMNLSKNNKEIRIIELRDYLNNVWSWQMERYNAEVYEIELGIRKENNFTISLENLIISRKDAVDEINQLEEEIKEYEATLKTLC